MTSFFSKGIRGEYGRVFERRGRKDFAESAEGIQKVKNKFKEEETKKLETLVKYSHQICSKFFGFLFLFFCALCEIFAPSAFKKSQSLR